MKELLGLVGFGPDETEAAKPVERKPEPRSVTPERPKVAEQPVAQEQPKAPERPPVAAEPKVERPVVQQPLIQREPAVERKEPVRPAAPTAPTYTAPEREPVRPAAPVYKAPEREPVRPAAPVYKAPEKAPEVEMEETRRKVASTVERSFFPFGKPKVKEPVYEEPVYTPPVQEQPPVEEYTPVEDDAIRPPFIRPGATVIAAGATFFGDIRAEGDVEVLGKVKGNLEATGNVRVLGKVLGDVKGEAVQLEGCTVQGNITSTSFVSLDAGAMVVGDVLATDFDSDGKVKGNLQIARSATFSSCALLAGNVIAATIMMAQGAKVQGAVRIAEDPEANALFGELEI